MNGVPLIVIIGGAAVATLLVLAIVLMPRRRKPRVDEEPSASFLGTRPQDTFASLGEPEVPAELADAEFRLDWGRGDDDLAPPARARRDDAPPAGGGDDAEARHGTATGAAPAEEPERETAGAHEAADAANAEAGDVAGAAEKPGGATMSLEAVGDARADVEAVGDARADVEAVGDAATAGADGSGGEQTVPSAGVSEGEEDVVLAVAPAPRVPRMVPLTDIIVTTSRKKVDLDDPEVRRMLAELVRYEIDQATEFSAAGQSVDAVLQLTEAEKVSRALGMDETAERIKSMMRELQD